MPDHAVENAFDFTQKVVLVTGGGSGLGAGISGRFAQAGASVVINYRSSAESAEQLAAHIEASGGQAVAVRADVTDPDDVKKLIKEVVSGFGRLDVLINNAGIYPFSPFLDMELQDWDRVVDANLGSTFLCTQAAARQMIAQGEGGAVVNIASVAGISPLLRYSNYSTAKAGVLMATRSMAGELGTHGIRVNAVSPGLIWREGLDRDWPDGVARYKQAAPLGRLGQPDDVADACLFLASSAARWITGINLIVDGGVMTNQIY